MLTKKKFCVIVSMYQIKNKKQFRNGGGKMFDKKIIPGQIYWINFGEGSEGIQGGRRPAYILQNQKGCIFSPTIRVVPLTAKTEKAKHLPMHVQVPKTKMNGLNQDSVALVEQETTIRKKCVGEFIGFIENNIRYKCGLELIKNSIESFPPEIVEVVERLENKDKEFKYSLAQ